MNEKKLMEINKEFINLINKANKKALENKSDIFECRVCRAKPTYLFKFENTMKGFYFCKEDLDQKILTLVLISPYFSRSVYSIIQVFCPEWNEV